MCAALLAPGCRSRKKPAAFTSSGRWIGNERIAVSSAAGPPLIVSCRYGTAIASKASNVIARLRNSCPCCSPTGATAAAVRSSAWNSWPKRVCGSARFFRTGIALFVSGSSATIASLMLVPRPASASPNSRRLTWFAARVGSSNMLKKSSNSTGLGVAFLSGSVPSSGIPLLDVPRVTSMYLRPSGERGRTMIVELLGQRLHVRLELEVHLRRDAAVSVRDRLDLVDDPDAVAADPHLVAGDEVRRVRQLHPDAVGRHERQAVVGVVGEEDGDEQDEHRRRADQHRVRRHGCAAPVHLAPLPPSR